MRLAPNVLVSMTSAPARMYSAVDLDDEVGLGEIQRVEAAVDEDALRVQHRAHRAVADEDTPSIASRKVGSMRCRSNLQEGRRSGGQTMGRLNSRALLRTKSRAYCAETGGALASAWTGPADRPCPR